MMQSLKHITDKPLHIIVAGGGTGGHIFPAIAIANAIKQFAPQATFLFIGAKGKMEMERVPQAGFQIVGIDIAGFNRSSLLKNIGLPFKLLKSFMQVRSVFKQFKPHAAIGVGGYSTFPVLRFAQSKGVPTFIFESNSHAGKSNILLGKRATKIFTASDGMERFFPVNKTRVTGNPIRKGISENAIDKAEALNIFGLVPGKLTVLAFGGSLGARSINEALLNGLDEIEKNNLQLIWQTGNATAAQYKNAVGKKSFIWINDFITNMDAAYAAADIIVSRSGSSVYELSVVGKPAILVPYPHAAENHQEANALNLVNKQAAIMIKDSEAVSTLVAQVIALAHDEERKKTLSENIKPFAITDADVAIARDIVSTIA